MSSMKRPVGNKDSDILFSLTGYKFSRLVLSQPIGGFIVCVVLSLIYNFDECTATHCRVANYLPSISAAIVFKPQCYIWRVCIGLDCAPRFMIAFMVYNHYKSFAGHVRWPGVYRALVAVNCLLHVVENASLMLLTYVSSTENGDVHEGGFVSFMFFSEVYMLLTLILFCWSRGQRPWSKQDQKSFNFKLTFFIANLSTFAAAVYFYLRHNTYCEPGMYTLFAFSEYLVVITNIVFHGSVVCDFDMGAFSFVVPKQSEAHTD